MFREVNFVYFLIYELDPEIVVIFLCIIVSIILESKIIVIKLHYWVLIKIIVTDVDKVRVVTIMILGKLVSAGFNRSAHGK